MLNNKKILLILAMLLPVSFSNAGVVGVGQIGQRYVYKINDVLVLVSEGDVIDGCTVELGSGLQCSRQNNNIDNKNALRNLAKKLTQLSLILDQNKLLESKLEEKSNEIDRIKLMNNKKIVQKNKRINQLSHYLNSIRN